MTRWLSKTERAAWIHLVALAELLPTTFDAQLRRDADLSFFGYHLLAMLSQTVDHTLPMSVLANRTNSTPSRLSHAVRRLQKRGMVERTSSLEDRRATNVHLTKQGWETVTAAAPAHVEHVRRQVFDVLTPEQVGQLVDIADTLLQGLDPEPPIPGRH